MSLACRLRWLRIACARWCEMGQGIEARFAEALRLLKVGQSEAALAQFTAITLERPQTAEAHFQIGRIHAAAGRLQQARAALMAALRLRPDEGAIQLAIEQVSPGAGRDALSLEMADVMSDEARVRFAQRLATSARSAAAELVLRPMESAPARQLLAQILADTARVAEAEALLSGTRPKSGELWFEIAMLRARLRRVKPAQEALRKAHKGKNPAPGSAIALAQALGKEGETRAAEAVLGAAIKAHPKAGMLYGQRGQLAQSAGNLPQAKADLEQALALDPKDGEAYRAYFAMQKVARDDPHVAKAEAALADAKLPPEARQRLHFALAKAQGDWGDDAASFAHLDAGNALQKKRFPFDFDQALAQSKAILAAVRRDLMGAVPQGPSGQVIFVAGLPRSGTTLIESVFAAHGDVTAGGELPFLVQALRQVQERIEREEAIAPADLVDPAERYLETARLRLNNAPIFTDKSVATPYRIGLAAFALPQAQFVIPRRDPRDVGLSIYRNMFADGTQRFSNDLYDIGRMIRLNEAMVAAWADLLPERVHFVAYEALTETPEPVIRGLVDAVGLPWDAACLAPQNAKRRVETLSFAQVRQPIYRDSISGWRRVAERLGPLEEGLAVSVELD